MKSYVDRHSGFIAYLAECSTAQAQTLIQICTDGELSAICEVALNYLNGHMKTTPSLDRRFNFFSNLASKDLTLDRKRQILVRSPRYTKVVQRLVKQVAI